MSKLDHYVNVGQKRLRCGFTTGTCAAAASRGAAEFLLTGTCPAAVTIGTPAGIDVTVEFECVERGENWAQCAVRKDGGDDPDVTDGALVFSRVSMAGQGGVEIDGGIGVGRVTREGLDQPVGAAAINHVPRQMIEQQVREAAAAASYGGGLDVEISIPDGVELAKRTFNPRLGIEGGISVLGTSGIVKPMSEDALISSIELEMSVLRARGVENLLITPGNYGRDFARDELKLDLDQAVQCSNYMGAALDATVTMGFKTVLIVGHLGKLVKGAAGIMNTHSRVSDARRETLAAHAAMAGASPALAKKIMNSITTDEIVPMLQEAGVFESVMSTLAKRLEESIGHRLGDAVRFGAIVFSNEHGLLTQTSNARKLLKLHVG